MCSKQVKEVEATSLNRLHSPWLDLHAVNPEVQRRPMGAILRSGDACDAVRRLPLRWCFWGKEGSARDVVEMFQVT